MRHNFGKKNNGKQEAFLEFKLVSVKVFLFINILYINMMLDPGKDYINWKNLNHITLCHIIIYYRYVLLKASGVSAKYINNLSIHRNRLQKTFPPVDKL